MLKYQTTSPWLYGTMFHTPLVLAKPGTNFSRKEWVKKPNCALLHHRFHVLAFELLSDFFEIVVAVEGVIPM